MLQNVTNRPKAAILVGMESWLIALIIKPFAFLGLSLASGKLHAFLYRTLPDGKVKTALLRER